VLDDAEMVSMLRKGDEDVFAQLVGDMQSRLLRVARSIVHRNELAEEVVQETWIAVIRGLDGFEGRSSLPTWLYRICVNRARSAIGKEGRSFSFDPLDPGVESTWFAADGAWAAPVEPWPDRSDARLDAAAMAPWVHQAIEGLPDAQRLVVTLRDVEGLSSTDVCDVLAITDTNQRVLLHRGRNRVRAELDRHVRGS
jgi:RNA polymerase sigma-70 factor, ECF subfamily